MTSEQNTCQNCEFWIKNQKKNNGACDFVDTIPGEKAFNNGHGAELDIYVHDDSGLFASLVTGPNFGCVNFEPKT